MIEPFRTIKFLLKAAYIHIFKHLFPRFLSSNTSTVHKYTPRYWTADGTEGSYRVDVDRETFLDIEEVVTGTWLSQFVGHGRDGVGLSSYSNIKVVKVERIQNIQLFSNYARRRQMLRKKAEPLLTCKVIRTLEVPGYNRTGTMTSGLVDDGSVLAADIYPEVNETYLFHGTLKENVDSIAEVGLLPGSESSMFGKGIYAAESSTKADQYSDSKYKREIKDEKQMFLVRACLGRVFHANSARKFVGMPCRYGCEGKCCCEEIDFCDSVVAKGYWNFREFVVFDSCQVYPEYLITYKRV